MKHIVFGLSLLLTALPAWTQNVRIQENRFEGRSLVRHGQLYLLLDPFSLALGARVGGAGDGYWSALKEGETPASVPAGLIQVGEKQIPLLLESGDVFVPAEAYCQALGLNTSRDAGGVLRVGPKVQALAVPRKSLPNDPEAYFVTQYRSRYNQSAPKSSANCGPACMAMVALAYGLAPGGLLPGDRQGLILWCRQSMTLGNQNEDRGTKSREIERMATQLGLQSYSIRRFQDLDQALAQGQLVVVGGDTNKLGAPGGDHFLLCVGRHESDYIINDPGGFFPTPGTRMTAGMMEQFFIEGISLYPKSDPTK